MFAFLTLGFLGFQAAAQTYCSSGPTTTVDSNLGTTTLNGDTLYINDTSNCPGTIGPKDLTAQIADVSSKTYILTTTVTTCGNSFPTLAGAWIDWNMNYIWEDDEKLGTFTTVKNAVNWSFTVPKDAKSGTTRMRVQVQETQATTLSPCASFPYGATKDFSIKVGSSSGDSYCVSGPLTVDDSNLGSVTMVGEFNNIRETSDCPGKTGPQYISNQSASVYRGGSYSLTFNVTTCSSNRYQTLSGAWIDYDHNSVFDTSETLGYTQGQGVQTLNFSVPNGTFLGQTMLRVQVQETTATTKLDPCATFSYGGTKDFPLILMSKSSLLADSK